MPLRQVRAGHLFNVLVTTTFPRLSSPPTATTRAPPELAALAFPGRACAELPAASPVALHPASRQCAGAMTFAWLSSPDALPPRTSSTEQRHPSPIPSLTLVVLRDRRRCHPRHLCPRCTCRCTPAAVFIAAIYHRRAIVPLPPLPIGSSSSYVRRYLHSRPSTTGAATDHG